MLRDVCEIRNINNFNILILVLGLFFNICGLLGNDYWWPEKENEIRTILISIGCSLLVSSVITFFTARYQLKRQKIKEIIDVWGLENIYPTRAVMNQVADQKQDQAKICIDVMAFGLSSWRHKCKQGIIKLLQNRVKIRILAPLPDTEFIRQREKDEDAGSGHICQSINQLADFVQDMQKYGAIELRYYSCLPLDFYFRIDDTLFIGPYKYKLESQQTVSYEFSSDGKMFKEYTEYFESVWSEAKQFDTLY